jgi:hypothetical protein
VFIRSNVCAIPRPIFAVIWHETQFASKSISLLKYLHFFSILFDSHPCNQHHQQHSYFLLRFRLFFARPLYSSGPTNIPITGRFVKMKLIYLLPAAAQLARYAYPMCHFNFNRSKLNIPGSLMLKSKAPALPHTVLPMPSKC